MSHGLPTGVHRPRPRGQGLSGSSLALAAAVAVAVVLWAGAAAQVATARADAGRPVSAAQVVTCPGGTGLCAQPTADPAAVLPLSVPGPFAPVPGDAVTVTAADGVATLAGGHAWFNLTLTLVLAAVLTGWSVRWWRRVLLAGTRPATVGPAVEDDVRRERRGDQRHVA